MLVNSSFRHYPYVSPPSFQSSPPSQLYMDGVPCHLISSSNHSSPTSLSPTHSPSVHGFPSLQHPYSSPPQSSPSALFMVPSPPASCLSTTNIRYEVILEAPTAAAQKAEESPLTYLNKGQFYNISLKDMEGYNGNITSTLIIMFHDENHRKVASNYWKFWKSQQKDGVNARAVDLDVSRSKGIQNVECKYFDRVTFQWNGNKGASVNIRFNCLSTDFSRIKGVKGIPLRLHMESHAASPEVLEKTYCRIKLFRDKGAERKNKDDAKYIERQLEKLRGKNGEAHPLWLTHSQTQAFTLFREIPASATEEKNLLLPNESPQAMTLPPPTVPCRGIKRPSCSPAEEDVQFHPSLRYMMPSLDVDPTYIPQCRRRIAKLSIFVRFGNSDVHRAVYLEHLTVQELIQKIAEKMNLNRQVTDVIRHVSTQKKDHLVVSVDDAMVEDIPEQQDMEIDTKLNDDGALTLILRY
ncbi:CP2 transcription factor-domain-containing protein [Radiomyces spectabilis]|uniref:CP2 transcription factor-domain-containing protein n=1 Tax=Radiomyces spectabilis TaxID=64574 RepID=UPI00221F0DDE|nr:CP2 transcription factor-domain-containing protein [Radiomyces spectabilis]KAI8388008.1 CP2 transcription factor-domain-containing protein [Radiomyces spectabilis]